VASLSAAEVGASYFFLTALFNMPLANLTAILQCVPLTGTLASALFLREAVGWRRMVAIAVGFIGVLLIVKPGADGFNVWSLYAVIAMLGVTFRDLITRKLSPSVPSMTVTMVTALTVLIAAALPEVKERSDAGSSTGWAAHCRLGGAGAGRLLLFHSRDADR